MDTQNILVKLDINEAISFLEPLAIKAKKAWKAFQEKESLQLKQLQQEKQQIQSSIKEIVDSDNFKQAVRNHEFTWKWWSNKDIISNKLIYGQISKFDLMFNYEWIEQEFEDLSTLYLDFLRVELCINPIVKDNSIPNLISILIDSYDFVEHANTEWVLLPVDHPIAELVLQNELADLDGWKMWTIESINECLDNLVENKNEL